MISEGNLNVHPACLSHIIVAIFRKASVILLKKQKFGDVIFVAQEIVPITS